MFKLTGIVTVLLMCGILLSGCGTSGKTQSNQTLVVSNDKNGTLAATDNSELVNDAQVNVKATIGQDFMTIKTEDGTAYTWDQGQERDELQGKLNTMLSSLTVKKVGVKKRPSPFVAMLFQNTSVIIPYGLSQPEKNIIIEDDEGTFVGECPKENLNSVLEWLKEHKVKIGK